MNVAEYLFPGSQRPFFARYFFRIYSDLVSIVGNVIKEKGSFGGNVSF